MINVSVGDFLETIFKIIKNSPSSLLFIVFGVIFVISMIINIKRQKTIGKPLFIMGWIFIILFVIIRYNSYIGKIFDNFINNVFMQIFFPNLATYFIIIIITNIIFLYTVFSKKTKISDKVLNAIFFALIIVIMIYTLEQLIENKINIYNPEEVYTNQTILILIEATTIIFAIWMFILLSKILLRKLITKNTEKIKQKYQNYINLDETDNVEVDAETTPDKTKIPNVTDELHDETDEETDETPKENQSPKKDIVEIYKEKTGDSDTKDISDYKDEIIEMLKTYEN